MADKQLVDRSTKFQSSPTETYFCSVNYNSYWNYMYIWGHPKMFTGKFWL